MQNTRHLILLLSWVIFFSSFKSFSQPTIINCRPRTLSGCNYISNNQFIPTAYDNTNYNHINDPFGSGIAMPFGNSIVNNWLASHGTPNLNDPVNWTTLLSPPPQASNYVFMHVGTGSIGNTSEGVVQKIPALTIGNTYVLSFFKVKHSYSPVYPIDNFNIYLINCDDYNNYFIPPSVNIPTIPPLALQVYCETTVSNNSWEQVFVKFTIPNTGAQATYNMIWVYPQENNVYDRNAGLYFTLPELIDVTNFSAGPDPSPGSCNIITIGPSTPNCSVNGAVFTWHGPNGQTITAPANQKIDVDASNPSNAGTWTLSMTVPNRTATNNSCSDQPASISDNVYVGASGTPVISGSITHGCNLGTQQLIPYSINSFCIPWECGSTTTLQSIYPSGNEWYVNGLPVPPPPGGNIPGVGYVGLSADGRTVSHGLSTLSPRFPEFRFQLRNPSVGCDQLSPATTIFYGPTFFPQYNWLGFYKPNYSLNITTPWNYIYGTGTVYTWNIPNTVITQSNPNDPQATVFFPTNVPIPSITGTLTMSNSPYCNGVYPVTFEYNPNLPRRNEKINEVQISAYPNPAGSQTMIKSNDRITLVEIFDINTSTISKRVKTNGVNSILINTSDLNPGVYICKVTTSSNTKVLKLQVVK